MVLYQYCPTQLLPLPVAPPQRYEDSVSAAPWPQKEASSSSEKHSGPHLQGDVQRGERRGVRKAPG